MDEILHHLRNRDSPVNANKQWFPMVSKWCRISSIHSIDLNYCSKGMATLTNFLKRKAMNKTPATVAGRTKRSQRAIQETNKQTNNQASKQTKHTHTHTKKKQNKKVNNTKTETTKREKDLQESKARGVHIGCLILSELPGF